MKSKLSASIKIWIVIYPSITLFLYLFGDAIATLPLYIRTLLLTLTLVPWMVFVGVPCLDLVLKRFSSGKQDKYNK